MSDNNELTSTDALPRINRRSVLKAAGATTAGGILFSGMASATDVPIDLKIDCLGGEVEVTVTDIGGERPADLLDDDLNIYLGKESVVTPGGANDDEVDAIAEIASCFLDEYSYKECPSPIALPKKDPEEPGDGSLVYTFDRADAGLDTVTSETRVVVAGVYQDPDGALKKPEKRYQSFDSLEAGPVVFDPATCCIECESDDLLVKYEWGDEDDDGDDEFFVEEGGDDSIELKSVQLDEDGEPEKACFETDYCELDAVVKAGPEYEVTEITDAGEFCVDGIDGRAISNVRFYCDAPDDLSVGNGRGN